MKTGIKILVLEHDPNDIDLLQYELKKAGWDYHTRIVQTPEDFEKALHSFGPDIILADYTLPSFDGPGAFSIRQQLAPNTPFIIVSGTIGEENAVELIKMGVTDYVLKDKIYQVVPRIQRALKEAEVRMQKHRTKKQLKNREAQLRKVMDLSLDVICTLNQEGRFVTIGAASKAVWGYAPEELMGTSVLDLVHAEDLARSRQAIAELASGRDLVNFENRYIRKDGTEVTLFWSAHWDPEEQLGYSVARDATEIKQAAEEIKRREKRFRSLLQNSTDGLTLLAANGRVVERSPSALKILGLRAEEVKGRFRTDLVHPEDVSLVNQTCAQVKKTPNESRTIEYRFLSEGGTYKWLETTLHNLLHEPVVGAIVLNFRDVTERKEAEIALRENEARLKQAQAIGHVGFWEMNWENRSLAWSDELCHIFGVTQDVTLASFEAFLSFIHPDDQPAVLQKIQEADACLEPNTAYFRIRTRPGATRYVVSEWQYDLDAQGKPTRVFGILQDITEMKLAEIAIEKSEKKYRNLFQVSPTPMWVFDAKTLAFLDVNEAAIQHYGYSQAEFLSMTLRDIRPKTDIAKMEQAAFNCEVGTGMYHGTFRHLTKTGKEIEVEIKTSYLDIGGRDARLVVATDVSERVRYLEAIQAQNAKLREIAWTQSHVVRAPLARMMGLIDLLQEVPQEQVKDTDIFNFVLASARELDAIIRDIVRKTELIQDQSIKEAQAE